MKGKGADAQHKALVQTTKHTLVHKTNMNVPLFRTWFEDYDVPCYKAIKPMSRLYIPSALYRNEITSNSSKRFLY